MRRPWFAAAVVAAAALAVTGTAAANATPADGPAPAAVLRIAPGIASPVPATFAAPPTTRQCQREYGFSCYTADQIEQAYSLPTLYRKGIDGTGQTIVVVDPYGSPTIRQDLARFDRTFHLPDPPSLRIVEPAGKVPPYRKNFNREGWAGETTLDVEYSHAMAPHAKMLLVWTPVSETTGTHGFRAIVKAEEYVVNHHLGGVISQSFSTTEETFPTAQSLLRLRGAYTDAARQGVTVLNGGGDSGAAGFRSNFSFYTHPVTFWPSSDPLVTSVGGLDLHLNAQGHRTAPDSVWNDTDNAAVQKYFYGVAPPNPAAGGGGKSVVFARPSWQDSVARTVGDHRGVPDISMNGACASAVDMYHSFAGQPAAWYPICGTSESVPLFAGIVSLADQVAGHPLGVINPAIYQLAREHAPGIVDITRGNNTVSFIQNGTEHTVRGWAAAGGYDLASGVGTIYAPDFVPELARLAG